MAETCKCTCTCNDKVVDTSTEVVEENVIKYPYVMVALGNGHGEDTPGKRSPDSRLLEYAYTREIVKSIIPKLEKLGIPYYLVVPENKDVSLQERVKRVNDLTTKNKAKGITTFYISVHVNANSNGYWQSANYWTAWTSIGQTQGDKLADCLYEAAHEVFGPLKQRVMEQSYNDGDPDYEANFYVLKNTNCAATLTENFFMDNLENVEFLLSGEGKDAIAEVHARGILYYIKNILKQ